MPGLRNNNRENMVTVLNETADTCVDTFETKLFTDLVKKKVISEDPGKIIDLLNTHSEADRKLSRNNEYHFEVAQELLTLYIKLN